MAERMSPSDEQHLAARLFASTDASQWAAEFCDVLAANPHIALDKEFMTTWFASAIETAKAVQGRAEKPDVGDQVTNPPNTFTQGWNTAVAALGMPGLRDRSPALVEFLRKLADEYGATGVKRVFQAMYPEVFD